MKISLEVQLVKLYFPFASVLLLVLSAFCDLCFEEYVTCFLDMGRIFGGCSSFTQSTQIFTEDSKKILISHNQV